MSIGLELAVIVALTLVNGVFTGAEIAMLSVRKTRLEALANQGSTSARAALRLRRSPETLLATIQIGITVIGASTAVFGGVRLEEPLATLFLRLGVGSASGTLAFALVIVLVSYLSLVLGELVPKSLALRSSERFALAIAPPLVGLSALSRPLVWLLTASSNVVLRPFRDRTTFSESRLAPDELQQLVEESAAAGALHPCAGELASRAIDLARLKVNALMTPRTRIVVLDAGAPEAEILDTIRRHPHARYPVFEGDFETVMGYVLARETYEAMLGGTFVSPGKLRPVTFFPETTPAIEVLRALQSTRQQLGLVVDEQGSIAGLVTIEDIVEDLFGDILEEHETPRRSVWRDEADGSVLASGDAP
ncbi:MAG: HlyC/CorC family transporter, partial [Deltaproteobacteria bacterium]|nr:HlyC/CorC family transporter [Deltaproteobacteria bacterium]